MELNCGIGVHGQYEVALLDAASGHLVESRVVDNVITDAGMAMLITNGVSGFYGEPRIGSGNTPVQFTDTTLASPISATGVYWDSAYGQNQTNIGETVRWALYPTDKGNGTIRELGVKANVSTQIMSRVVVNPPIEKSSSQIMLFAHRLRLTAPGMVMTGIQDNRSPMPWVVRWCMTQAGLYEWLLYGWDTSSMFTYGRWGQNNTTHPSPDDVDVIASSGLISLSSENVAFTQSIDPAAGYWRRAVVTIPAGTATGTLKEIFWRGVSGSVRKSLGMRITFDNGLGGGLVKAAGDTLALTMKYTLTRA